VAVREDLVLIGWLADLAPEASATAGAGALALDGIRGAYPSAQALDDALSNCLRRAAATALLHLPEQIDPVAGQRAVLADRAGFARALGREEPALVAVAALLDALPPTRGWGARLAPAVLETFRIQARDLFPREDMGGAPIALAVVEALAAAADPHRRQALARDRAALHARVGAAARAAELRGPRDGRSLLAEADEAAVRRDLGAARELLDAARPLFAAAGDLQGLAAVCRREAALLPPEARNAPLREAVRLARAAGDGRGEAEAFDEIARARAEAGQLAPAVAALGEVARLARLQVDAAAEARALQLAGRLLCEAPTGEDDPGAGLVMLLRAGDLGASVDPLITDEVRRYVSGFQYTLSDARFAAIEPLLDADRDEVVTAAFARYRAACAAEDPGVAGDD
jgi:hypothetical protein